MASDNSGTRDARRMAAEEILENVGCGIWLFDGEQTIYVNRALEELTGFTREELLAPNAFGKLLHPDDERMVWERGLARMRGEQVPAEYEISLVARDGSIVRVAVHARLVGPPLGPGSLVSAVNVTAAYRAEQAIRESEAYHRGVLDSVPAFVITTDPTGTPTYINRNWLEAVDVPRSAGPLNAGTGAVIHRADARAANRAWKAALASGEGYDIDYRVRMRTGEYRWVSWRIRPIHRESGELAGWSGVGIDVQAAKQLQLDLESALEQLRLATAVKDEFLGLVSHELRTPLTTIVGLADFLARNSDGVSEDVRDTYEQLRSDARRLQSLVENLLVLARLDETALEFEPVLPHHVIEEAVRSHRTRHTERQVSLFASRLPPVMMQESLFRLVIENLLTNAEKYSPATEPIEIDCRCDRDTVVIAVHDHGPGVPLEDQPKLFDPFFRSRGAIASQKPGAGLGLAVCKRLLELHKGSIRFAEHEGGGATFEVSLPAATILAEASDDPSWDAVTSGSEALVIVDSATSGNV